MGGFLGIGAFRFSAWPVEGEEGGIRSLRVHAGIYRGLDALLSHLGHELIEKVFHTFITQLLKKDEALCVLCSYPAGHDSSLSSECRRQDSALDASELRGFRNEVGIDEAGAPSGANIAVYTVASLSLWAGSRAGTSRRGAVSLSNARIIKYRYLFVYSFYRFSIKERL